MRGTLRKPTILAVDDTPANLVALEAVLEKDFRLVFAHSGAEAIDLVLGRSDIDVILLDLQMPNMDGFEAAERIKKITGCEDIPIVFVTAIYHEDPFLKRGYEVGAVDYFTKPFDPELLRLRMSLHASSRRNAAVLEERAEQIDGESEDLLEAGRKLSAVLESLPVGVLIADTHGRVCQTNDEVARICRGNDLIEHDAYGEMFGWWSRDGLKIKGPLARALRSGESSHNEQIQILCFDGATKKIAASASPLLGIAGKIVGAVIVIKDATESEQIGEALEQRVVRLVSLAVELEQSLDQAGG